VARARFETGPIPGTAKNALVARASDILKTSNPASIDQHSGLQPAAAA
jgi:hypothetical protein